MAKSSLDAAKAGTVQREELEALSSIFGNDVRVEKPVWGNLSFTVAIRLLGQDSAGAQIQSAPLELGVVYTAKYPRTAPTLDVRSLPKGDVHSVDPAELLRLKNVLVAKAAEFAQRSTGDPYVFEIIRFAQDYLVEKSRATRKSHVMVETKVHQRVATDTQLKGSAEANVSVLEEEARARKREAWLKEQIADEKTHKVSTVDAAPQKGMADPAQEKPPLQQTGKKGGRYYSDYEDLGAVGRGGFGHVYKARNRLDGMIYAVKKIRLENDDEQNRKIRSEVKTLARLVHPNIVRYFAAWVEEDETAGEDGSESDESEFSEMSKSEPSILRPASSFNQFLDHDDDMGGFMWAEASASEDEEASGSRRPSLASTGRRQMHSRNESQSLKQMLYIVMEFVPRTIRALVDSRELVDQDDRCFELIREILEALSCVHELHIIHQDIKPENLLIDENGRVKLGDFGLAVQQEEDRDAAEVGTTYYRAPEVGHGAWDERCDIFSLGVVLVEIFSPPTETGMERHKILTSLRLEPPVLPEGLKNEQAMHLARQMLQKDPKKRPSAAQALQAVPGHVLMEHAVDTVIKGLAFGSNAHKRLLKHLFSHSTSYEADAAFDYDPAASDGLVGDDMDAVARISSRALSELSAANALPPSESLVPINAEIAGAGLEAAAEVVVQGIGAIRFRAPLLAPSREMAGMSAGRGRAASLLDVSGVPVTLPHGSLTRPLARFLALNRSVRTLRRYDIGNVYSRAGGGGQPHSQKQLCLDTVAPFSDLGPEGTQYAMNEQIEAMKNCLGCSRLGLNSMTFEIGHAQFLRALFEAARLPAEAHQLVLQTIWRYEFFRDLKHATEVLVNEANCPVGSVQALKPFLPIGKRMWVSGTLSEILPQVVQRSRSPSLRESEAMGLVAAAQQSKAHEEAGVPAEQSDEAEHVRRRGERRRLQQANPGVKQSAAATIAISVHPVEHLLEHATNAKMTACAQLLREMWAVALSLLQGPGPARVRLVLWTEPPNDVTGLFYRAMIRRRRTVYRGGKVGASRQAAVSYEEGHEFVAADGGRFDELITSFAPNHAKVNAGDLVGITSRLYLDRINKLRVHGAIEDLRKRPLIRFCWPMEKDAARFDCQERCHHAARLRKEIHLGVEWMHPVGLSGDALLALCNESGGRVMINKLIVPAALSSATSGATVTSSDAFRVRGWSFPSGAVPSETDLHLGVYTDKRCESWTELVKVVSHILGMGRIL